MSLPDFFVHECKTTVWRNGGVVSWVCPRCGRSFRRAAQRHACGLREALSIVRDRPKTLAELYRKLESTLKSYGAVEVVTRDRYALFRTTRIFTDLTVTRDALRVVIHLARQVNAPVFVKVGRSGKRVSHVTFIRTPGELRTIAPFLREAYDLAIREEL
jgi:Domain of unknown function (DUF5655)